ncbi:PorV/PorQ family protein [Rubrivirga sp.]|uniref:PorV/PorQ family protein n=1 Tax=Rubrivirga sp. TaxID=1885344 RepID=UPI003C732632
MTRLLLISGLALALAAPAFAQDDGVQVLTTAVPFLQIEPDSRAAGMGMAGVAVADNAYAPWWNPAGLAGQEGTEVSFTHAPWLPALGANLSYEHLSAKHGLGSAGTLGGHLTYFDLGTQIATNDQGQELGEFSSYELALGLSYGYPVTENLAVGLGTRFIYSNLTGGQVIGQNTETSAGTSIGVDLGMKYTAPDIGLGESSRPSIAFNLANMGPGISYTEFTEVPDAIPTTLRMGLALDTEIDEFNRLLLALDVNKIVVNPRRVEQEDGTFITEYDPFYEALFTSWESRTVKTTTGAAGLTCDDLAIDDDSNNDCRTVSGLRSLTLGTGMEYWYNDLLALRAGYFYEDPANGNRQFITFGTGIRYSLVGVDISYIYALQENSPLADQLRFSLLLNIPR